MYFDFIVQMHFIYSEINIVLVAYLTFLKVNIHTLVFAKNFCLKTKLPICWPLMLFPVDNND